MNAIQASFVLIIALSSVSVLFMIGSSLDSSCKIKKTVKYESKIDWKNLSNKEIEDWFFELIENLHHHPVVVTTELFNVSEELKVRGLLTKKHIEYLKGIKEIFS